MEDRVFLSLRKSLSSNRNCCFPMCSHLWDLICGFMCVSIGLPDTLLFMGLENSPVYGPRKLYSSEKGG